MSRILCFDPSGNFSKNEGKGTTGWALFECGHLKDFGDIQADKYASAEGYWEAHIELLNAFHSPYLVTAVVCESFKLQPGKAMAQSWSSMETPQLIGVLRMGAWRTYDKFVLQDPSIKTRVTDPILEHMGIVEKRGNLHYVQGRQTNLHMRDAIRHGVYYLRYGDKDAKR